MATAEGMEIEELGREGVGITEMEEAEEGADERQGMDITEEMIEITDLPRILTEMEMEGDAGEEMDFHKEEVFEEVLEEAIEEDNEEEGEEELAGARIAGDSFLRPPIGRNRNSTEETKVILTLPKITLTLHETTQTLPKIRLEAGKPTSHAMKCGREAIKI